MSVQKMLRTNCQAASKTLTTIGSGQILKAVNEH